MTTLNMCLVTLKACKYKLHLNFQFYKTENIVNPSIIIITVVISMCTHSLEINHFVVITLENKHQTST